MTNIVPEKLKNQYLVDIAQQCSRSPRAQGENSPINLHYKQRYKLLNAARDLLSSERIARCQRAVVPQARYVAGRYQPPVSDDQEATARLRNLVRCNSDACPVCSLARARRAALELAVAVVQCERKAWDVALLTVTFAHSVRDTLIDGRAAVIGAYRDLFAGRNHGWLVEEWGFVGAVRSVEVTYGKNGWNAHIHALLMFSRDLWPPQIRALESALSKQWLAVLKRKKRRANRERGLTLKAANSDIAEYISKWGKFPIAPHWGAESEVAAGHTKKAKIHGLTPFGLLMAYAGDSEQGAALYSVLKGNPDTLKARAGALFVEYFQAFKGNARLHWGKGLRAALDLDAEVKRVQAASERVNNSYDLVLIERGEPWAAVLAGELRADLLAAVRTNDAAVVQGWLDQHQIPGIVIEPIGG